MNILLITIFAVNLPLLNEKSYLKLRYTLQATEDKTYNEYA